MALKIGLDPASSIGNWAQKSGSVKILKLVKIGKKTSQNSKLIKNQIELETESKNGFASVRFLKSYLVLYWSNVLVIGITWLNKLRPKFAHHLADRILVHVIIVSYLTVSTLFYIICKVCVLFKKCQHLVWNYVHCVK